MKPQQNAIPKNVCDLAPIKRTRLNLFAIRGKQSRRWLKDPIERDSIALTQPYYPDSFPVKSPANIRGGRHHRHQVSSTRDTNFWPSTRWRNSTVKFDGEIRWRNSMALQSARRSNEKSKHTPAPRDRNTTRGTSLRKSPVASDRNGKVVLCARQLPCDGYPPRIQLRWTVNAGHPVGVGIGWRAGE